MQNDPYGALLNSAASPTEDPYGALLRPDPTLHATTALVVGGSPDTYAKLRKDAGALGYPVAAAEALPEQTSKRARAQEIDTATAATPVLRRKYSDADFAKLGHDEPGILAAFEKNLQGFFNGDNSKATMEARRAEALTLPKGSLDNFEFTKRVRDIKETQGVDWDTARGMAARGVALDNTLNKRHEPPMTPENWVRGKGVVFMDGLYQKAYGAERMAADFGGDDLRAYSAKLNAAMAAEHRRVNVPQASTFTLRAIDAGVDSTLQNAPGVAVGIATGSVALPLADAFASQALPAYTKYRNRGAGGGAAFAASTGEGALTVLTELAPMSDVVNRLGRVGFNDFLKKYIGKEMLGEQISTLGNNIIDTAVANPTKTWGDFVKEIPQEAYATAISTLVQSGLMSAAGHAASKTFAAKQASDFQIAQAMVADQKLQQAFTLAGQAKLRERSPETFVAAAQAMAEGTEGAPTEVRFDAKTLAEVLAQEDIDRLPSVQAQLARAAAIGGEVTVPFGELMLLAGTPAEKALAQHARVGDAELSIAEAKEAQAQADTYLQSESARVMAEAVDTVAHTAEVNTVKQAVLKDLAALKRFTPDVHEAYATVTAAMYSALSSRLGMTPNEVFAKYPLTIDGVNPATQGVLSQSKGLTIEGYHYSKQARPVLSTHAYGTNAAGSGKDGYTSSEDKRLGKRLYFYADKGTGINPEAGVGGVAHRAALHNVYDADADTLRLNKGGPLAFESAVLDAGFSGYMNRLQGSQSAQVIMLGDHTIPAELLGPMAKTKGAVLPPPALRASLGRDVAGDALRAEKGLPAGDPTLARWQEILERTPEVLNALTNAGVFSGDLSVNVYRDGLVKMYEALTDSPVYAQGANDATETNLPRQGARATLDDFSVENIGGVLGKDNWSILTAENPMGEQASAEDNAAKMAELKADLDALGVQYTEAVGKYGQVENSLVVTGITEADAVALGAKYAQDSVLTPRGLVYPRDGSVTPVTGKIDVFSAAPEDFYTTIPSTGAKFAIELDWRESATDYSVKRTDKGFEALDSDGKVIGKLESNITPEQSKQINEPASVDIVKVNDDRKGQGVGRALYAAWNDAHEGRITPSGKTSADAWALWKRNYPEKVQAFVIQEAGRIAAGAPEHQVLGNITDTEVKQRVVDAGVNKYQGKFLGGRNPETLNQEEVDQYNALASGQTQTPAFKKWFGDSKAVDAEGNPRVVYHGTGASFTEFDPDKAIGGQFWFTTDKNAILQGEVGAQGKGHVVEAFLSLQNPAGWSDYDKFTLDQLIAKGHDGLMLPDGDQTTFVAFDPVQIKAATGNSGEFSGSNPNIFRQGKTPRGTFNPSTLTLSLLENANLSTYTHELGHMYLEVLADIAAQPNAPASLVNDMGTLLQWFGVKDLPTWRNMTLNQKRANHEKFAEGFEAYLDEGKAPSTELQAVFRQFSAWMKQVYKMLQDVMAARKATLTPEVREVFDRMLAADAQIEETEHARNYAPLFKSAEQAGMTPEAWALYQLQGQDATEAAVEALQARSLRDMKWTRNAHAKETKRLTKDAAEKRRVVEAEVRTQVEAEPVYAAGIALKSKDGPKLSTEALEAMYGGAQEAGKIDRYALLDWKRLIEQKMARIKGEHPDVIADSFGFDSGDSMVKALLAAEPKEAAIEALTDQRMLERYGDLSSPLAIENAANKAVHNEARARFIATELNALNEGMRSPPPDRTKVLLQLRECLLT